MAGLEFYRERFAESGWKIFERAVEEARGRGQNRVGIEHVVAALLEERQDLFHGLLQSLTEQQRALAMLRELIEESVEAAPKYEREGVQIASETVQLFKRALSLVRWNGRKVIEDTDLFIVLLMDEKSLLKEILRELIADPDIRALSVRDLIAVVRSVGVRGNFSEELKYIAGERVRIKAGPFAAFTGEIEKVDEEASMLNVRVFIMGREQPVEIRFIDAEKVEFNKGL